MLIPTNIPVAGFSGTTTNLGRGSGDGGLPPVGFYGVKEIPTTDKKKKTEE